MKNENEIKTWMFRKEGEILTLFLTVLIIFSLGFLLSYINPWLAVAVIIWNIVLVRLQQLALIGNSLRIHKEQFPELYEKLVNYAKQLNVSKLSLYISQDPNPNAYTFGFPTPSVVITSALYDSLTEKELVFVLAHELGHVKAGHNIINAFISPVGSTITGYWNYLFSFWSRKAEYTADRCALILTKDLDSSINALLKISAGPNLAKYIDLGGYRKQLISANNFISNLGEITQSHPYTTNRVRELISFKKEYFIKNY